MNVKSAPLNVVSHILCMTIPDKYTSVHKQMALESKEKTV